MNAGILMAHEVVSKEQWLERRRALLAREKALTHLADEVARERRALPWQGVEKAYVFDTPQGRCTLADLFAGRRQLIVQHFMLGPGWAQGCPSCSYMADHSDGMTPHLAQRDITLVAVSRAPLAEIEVFRQRMGWRLHWASAFDSDFNHDFAVSFTPQQTARGEVFYNYQLSDFPGSEAPGISVFVKHADGTVFHSYSTFGRGVEVMMGAYRLMDLTPKGRDENDGPYKMDWVRHHDRYEPAPVSDAAPCCSSRE